MQSVVSAIKSDVSAIQQIRWQSRVGRWQLTGQVVAAAEQSGR